MGREKSQNRLETQVKNERREREMIGVAAAQKRGKGTEGVPSS
jgi:hypothetical protein